MKKVKKTAALAAVAEVSPSSASPVQLAPENPKPENEEVARLAYSYWEGRGRHGGSPEEDWYKAEGELKARTAAAGK